MADTFPIIPIMTREGLVKAKWGLVPHWVKDKDEAMKIRKFNINARQESFFQKPSFRGSMTNRRCLVPVNSFFEYKHLDDKSTELYEITLFIRKIFCLAEIYDEWVDKESGKTYRSFAIITTEANKQVKDIHDRMPVILTTKDEEDLWLNSGNQKIVKELMGSYDLDNLRATLTDKEVRDN